MHTAVVDVGAKKSRLPVENGAWYDLFDDATVDCKAKTTVSACCKRCYISAPFDA
jgi:hypothetical protein